MKITNATELGAFVKGWYEQHVTALNGILEKLPENLKSEFTKLRDGLTTQMQKLSIPTTDNAWDFNVLSGIWSDMANYSNTIRDRLTQLSGELQTQALALNGLEQKIATGDYISKEKSTEACQLARTEGANSMLPEILATRKSALEACGLPVPPDAVLSLPSKDYEPKLAAAKEQVGKLGAKGLKLGGKGAAWVTSMAWLGATEFNGQMTALEEILGAAPAAGKQQPTGDPLLGVGNPPENKQPAGPAVTLA